MRASHDQDGGTYFSGSARMAVPLVGLEVMNASGTKEGLSEDQMKVDVDVLEIPRFMPHVAAVIH